MGRRLVAFLTIGAATVGLAAAVATGGSPLRVLAETADQGSAEPVLTAPAPRPMTSSTLGLFDDVELAGAWAGLGGRTVETLEVGSGDTLLAMLVNAGSPEPEAARAVAAVSDIFNPRRLQIGQVVTAVFGPAAAEGFGELTAISLALGDADYVVANRTTDGDFVARRSDQPLDAALTAPIEPEPTIAGQARVRDTQIRRGDTLMRLIVREGVGRAEADKAIQAMAPLFNPQGLQIGQELQILIASGPVTELLGIGLRTGEDTFVIVERNASGAFVARRSDAPAAQALDVVEAAEAELAPLLASMDAGGATVEHLTIGRGDTLMGLIVEAGATISEAHEAARVLGRHFDPRRLQIGQSLYVVRTPGPAGSGLEVLGLVVLDAGEEGRVAVVRETDGEGFAGQRIESLDELALLAPAVRADGEAAAADPAPAPDFGRDVRVELVTAAAGDTLTSMLTRAGASRVEADRLVRALRPQYDPRRLQIGQEMRAAFENIDGTGEILVAVSVKLKDDLYVQSDLQGSGFVTQRTTTPLNPSFASTIPTLRVPVAATAGGEEVIGGEIEEEIAVVAATPAHAPAEHLPPPISPLEAEIGLSDDAEQVWFEIQPGDTVGALLRDLTANGKEIAAVTKALDAEFDPRRLQIGQQVVVIIDKDAAGVHIVALSLALDDGGTLAVVRQHDGGYTLREASSHIDLSDYDMFDGGAEAVPAMPDLVAVWPERPVTLATASLEIAAGGTLMNALLDLGIDTGQAHAAIESLREVFNPRSIRAGQAIAVTHQGDDLFGLEFSPRPGERMEVARTDDGYVSREVVLPLQRSLEASRGSIRTSLYQAAEEAGVPLPVLADLIRAYSFDVDFQREIRTGDTFDVLYEVYRDEDGNVVRYGAPLYGLLNVSGVSLPIYRYTPGSGFTDYFNDKGESVRKALLRTPVDGAKITSGFGMRDHPLLGYSRMHKGVDFGAPSGTPILAAGDGTIDFIGTNGGYGKYIRIRHNSTYMTAYAHMSGYGDGLGVGSRVRQGQVIGYVGSTGQSTGPHLHYEVLVNNEQINPLDIKLPSGEVLAGAELDRFYRERDGLDAQYADVMAQSNIASFR